MSIRISCSEWFAHWADCLQGSLGGESGQWLRERGVDSRAGKGEWTAGVRNSRVVNLVCWSLTGIF